MRFPPLFWVSISFVILAVIGCETLGTTRPTSGPSNDESPTFTLAAPPPSNSTSIPQHTTKPTPDSPSIRQLDPVPTIPSAWITIANLDGVNVYLGEKSTSAKMDSIGSEAKTKVVSRAVITIENVGNSVVQIGKIWLASDPDCYDGKLSFRTMMQAFIVADDWLNVSAVPSRTVVGLFSERTFFRNEQDVWAKEHTDEFGYSFEVFPERWIRIVAETVWSPETFGDCVRISLKVNQTPISMPLPRPN